MSEGILRDRRSFARLACALPMRISDYYDEWSARCVSLSTGGCFVETSQGLDAGQDLELTLVDEELDAEIVLESQLRWVRNEGLGAHGAGFAFTERRTERLELLHDLVDRLAVSDVQTAAYFRAASEPLSIMTVLYVARAAPSNPVLSNDERSFLACVDGNTNLAEIKEQMDDASWNALAHAPFSLLSKGVLTTAKIRGVVGTHRKALGARKAATPKFLGGGFSRQQTDSRNAQAQEHVQKANAAIAQNDLRLARTHLMLAMQLAPGDPEISAAFANLNDS